MFKVDKNVELPPYPTAREPKYPWAEMEPTDSFFVPSDKKSFSAAFQHMRHHSGKYVTRKATEYGVVGFRVWRVE